MCLLGTRPPLPVVAVSASHRWRSMSSDRTNSSVEKPWQLKGGLPLKKTRLWDPLFEMQPAYQKQVPVEVLWFEGYGVETSRGPWISWAPFTPSNCDSPGGLSANPRPAEAQQKYCLNLGCCFLKVSFRAWVYTESQSQVLSFDLECQCRGGSIHLFLSLVCVHMYIHPKSTLGLEVTCSRQGAESSVGV